MEPFMDRTVAASGDSDNGLSADDSMLCCQRNISEQSQMRPQNLLERVAGYGVKPRRARHNGGAGKLSPNSHRDTRKEPVRA